MSCTALSTPNQGRCCCVNLDRDSMSAATQRLISELVAVDIRKSHQHQTETCSCVQLVEEHRRLCSTRCQKWSRLLTLIGQLCRQVSPYQCEARTDIAFLMQPACLVCELVFRRATLGSCYSRSTKCHRFCKDWQGKEK